MPEQGSRKATIPVRFEPMFWSEADGRCAVVKEIRRRYGDLKEDAGVDSVQKELLCQRAVFLSVQLETIERKAVEAGSIEVGTYTQMVNALTGLLKCLGLDRKFKQVVDLNSYLNREVAQ